MFTTKLIAVSALALQQATAVNFESQSVPFWPYPSGEVTLGTTKLSLNKYFRFKASTLAEAENSIMRDAFSRYEDLIAANSDSK
jgi:hypothetical protein